MSRGTTSLRGISLPTTRITVLKLHFFTLLTACLRALIRDVFPFSPCRTYLLPSTQLTISVLQWLCLYILDRFQVVVVNSISSTPQRLDFGVPQGSVLEPLLFVLYTQPVSCIDLHKFSDDTQLFSSALPVDFGTLIKQTETCVEHVKAWMDSNKLILNDDKTEALVVGTRSRTGVCYSEHLNIGGSPISFQPKVKSLGVVLDSSLTMSHHISSVVLPTLNCVESVPSVHSWLQARPQLLFVLEFYLGLITAIPYWQVSLQIK